MKILLVSDVHSRFRSLDEILKSIDFDLLLLSGDITDFSVSDVFRADEVVSKYVDECYAVHGNCDYEDVLNLDLDAIRFIHGKSVRVDDFVLHGLGGSTFTPFNTPSEYPESELEAVLKSLDYSDRNILLSHTPPKGILDLTYTGVHAGSSSVRKYMEKFELVLCGHIHEAYGVHKGSAVVVNPGPAAWSRFAIVDTESGEVKLGHLTKR